jgi:hypothetical protein
MPTTNYFNILYFVSPVNKRDVPAHEVLLLPLAVILYSGDDQFETQMTHLLSSMQFLW